MSSVVLSGDSSGTVTLTVPSAAGTNTITLPAATGTAVVAGANSSLVSGTAVATTSGTSQTITGIPSWAKRVTVILNAVSVNGATVPAINIQIGSGSLTTTGYSSSSATLAASANSTASTTGFVIRGSGGAGVYSGTMTLALVSGNTWVSSHACANPGATQEFVGGGVLALSGALDRVAIVTTDAMNGGSFNILWE